MSDQDFNNLREFDRQAIDFEAEIKGFSQSGEPFCDHGQLKDISGGGVGLTTSHPDHYKVDQQLELEIKLPDTDELEAFMKCQVTVEWIRSDNAESGDSGRVLIGVSLNGQMSFDSRKHSTSSHSTK
ncbi:PilZ domain-containing protein [Mariprofundus ferrinatatus]|uniref:PilZ domain-containing protein n=1 Tax=Mariprofundus ferrinatatus TaxID=1921087 RepID=A0A2K8L9Z0_9PROT|nr:PilZ domain-containing protein [Mariprofundus ferrinatatus]ATX81764.1 PilZ domain-containing protein [Mariprofundus ferrinatatus]